MLPILFKIPIPYLGSIPLHSYGLMIAIGFLLSLHFVQRDAKKFGIDPKVFADVAFPTLILGIIGTRLLHIIMFPALYAWNDPIGWIAVWRGGLVFQGGIPLAATYFYWHLRRNNVSFLKGVDIVLPYLALAHGIGRLGCFLNGCCYGKPSTLPWAIRFRRIPADITQGPTGSPAYLDHIRRFGDLSLDDHWSHPIHPTQLYSFLGLLTLCLILLYLRKHWYPFTGFILPTYLLLYGIFRFSVEFLRGDHNPVHMGIFTDQQIFALFSAILGITLFLILRKLPNKTPAPSQG